MADDSKPKKVILLVAAGLVVLTLAVIALRKAPATVPLVRIVRENISETITSNGKVEPVDPMVARAAFPTFISKVMATEGQAVRRGQGILSLDVADVRAQLAEARANLLSAETQLRNSRSGGPPDELAQIKGNLDQARVDVQRLEHTQKALDALLLQHAATQEEVSQNQASLDKARSQVKELEQRKEALAQKAASSAQSAELLANQAQDQVNSLAEKVRSANVIAPTDGTLYSLPVRAGDYVKVGDVLAEMADLRNVRVRAYVDEPDLGRLASQQKVQITWDAKPGESWVGAIQQVPKQVVPHGMRSVGEVLCSVDNGNLELLPNINVEITILVVERNGILTVPRSAVREEDGKHYVFVFSDGKIHRREVSVGISSASKYEVLSGLAQDDQVALPGDRNLRDGMEIRPAEGS